MQQKLSTKALPQYNWGQEWVKPNGELSCIIIIYEDLDEPTFLHKAFPDDVLPYYKATSSMSENTFRNHYPNVVRNWISEHPDDLVLITSCHAFALNLITNSNFRPDMFYLYDKEKGYRRLPDTTPMVLKRTQNYQRMYIAGTFDGGVGSFKKAGKPE